MRKSGVAIALAGALMLAACGSAGPSESVSKTTVPVSPKVVLASLDATTAAKTARIDVQTEMSFGGQDVTMRGDGAIDFGSGDSQLTMSYDGLPGAVLQDGMEIRSVDGVVYLRLPGGLGNLPGIDGDKPWIAIDTTKPGGSSGSLGAFDMTGQSDPTKALAYLEQVSNDVRQVGTDEIRGVETTHYRATLDLSKSVDESDAPEGLRDAMQQFTQMVGDIPADVWIDGDGMMRRERIQIDFGKLFGAIGGAESGAEAGVMTQQIDLFDFGTSVNVEAPPADQVQTFGGGYPSLRPDSSGRTAA